MSVDLEFVREVEKIMNDLLRGMKDDAMSSNGLVPLDKVLPKVLAAKAKLTLCAEQNAFSRGGRRVSAMSITTGGPPPMPPPTSIDHSPHVPLPNNILEKAKAAARANAAAQNNVAPKPPAAAGSVARPPSGPPRGPPPPLPSGASAAAADAGDNEALKPLKRLSVEERNNMTEEERAEREEEEAKRKKLERMKQRVSGGVMLFAPGAVPNLGMGMLKKADLSKRPSKEIEVKTNTFVKPALRHVQRDSAKDSEGKTSSFGATAEGDEEADEEGGEEATDKDEGKDKSAGNDKGMDAAAPQEEEEGRNTMDDQDADALEWEERKDHATGVSYYYNLVTSEASWTAPATGFVAIKVDKDAPEWEQRMDVGSGVFYYFNLKTHEAVWEAPEKFVPMEVEKEAEKESKKEAEKTEGVGEEWEEKMDEASGYPYYQHKTTGQAVWTIEETRVA
jgi:hypothetical protein